MNRSFFKSPFLVVALLALALLVVFMPGRTQRNKMPRTESIETTPSVTDKIETGARLYQQSGCATCHGTGAEGTARGPALTELEDRWDPTVLSAYLKNPKSYREKDERLQRLSKRYFPVLMPGLETLNEAERSLISDYLLRRLED